MTAPKKTEPFRRAYCRLWYPLSNILEFKPSRIAIHEFYHSSILNKVLHRQRNSLGLFFSAAMVTLLCA